MQDLPQPPPQHFQYLAPRQALTPLAKIIKFPTTKEKAKTYHDLVCTQEDRTKIHELIMTMAKEGKISLLFKQSYLRNLGAEVNHVHPLKFLATVFTNPRLKECMCEIFDDYFKRNGFMDGLGPALSREADLKNLSQYINDFAAEIKVPANSLNRYFKEEDWEGLVRFLMSQ